MALNKFAAIAITTAAGMASKLLFQKFVGSKITLTAPKEDPVVVPTPEEPVKAPELKVVRPTLRAVTDPAKSLPREEAMKRLVDTLAQLPTKGVLVQVVSDDVQAPVQPIEAEVVITEPRDSVKHAVAQEVLEQDEQVVFWDNFVDRIKVRGELVIASDEELINMKDIGKGYHLVRLTDSNEVGIMHVTKKAINALFPQGEGSFRVVGNNKRFDGKDYVDAAKAKGFLNGRY